MAGESIGRAAAPSPEPAERGPRAVRRKRRQEVAENTRLRCVRGAVGARNAMHVEAREPDFCSKLPAENDAQSVRKDLHLQESAVDRSQ